MIDPTKFTEAWASLCKRFGRELDAEEARMYRSYLEGHGLDTEEFLVAARTLWASREFFPRPADFLLHRAGSDWAGILEFQRRRASLDGADAWHELRREFVTDRGWAALSSLGGLRALEETRDLTRLRRDFLDAYDLQVTSDTAQVARKSVPGRYRSSSELSKVEVGQLPEPGLASA